MKTNVLLIVVIVIVFIIAPVFLHSSPFFTESYVTEFLLESLSKITNLVLGLFFVISFIIFVIQLMRKNHRKIVRYGLIAAVLSISFFAQKGILLLIQNINKQAGSSIAIALNEYCKDHNEYPDSLELLVPNYLNKIPKTAFFQQPSYDHYYLVRISEDTNRVGEGPDSQFPYYRESYIEIYPGYFWNGVSYYRYQQYFEEDMSEVFPCGERIIYDPAPMIGY